MHTDKFKVVGNIVWQSCSGEYFEMYLDVIEKNGGIKQAGFQENNTWLQYGLKKVKKPNHPLHIQFYVKVKEITEILLLY